MTVLVAGAGPAGARLAQQLAIQGISVILVERLIDPQTDAFSSAVVPIQALADLSIPDDSISTIVFFLRFFIGFASSKYNLESKGMFFLKK